MKPLSVRKQLLISESEINRNLLIHDLTELKQEVADFTERSRTLIGMASAVASLLTGLASHHREQRAEAEQDSRPWWVKGLFKGAGALTSLWQMFRGQMAGHDQVEAGTTGEHHAAGGKTGAKRTAGAAEEPRAHAGAGTPRTGNTH